MWIQEATGKPLPGTLDDRPPEGGVWIEDDDIAREPGHDDGDRSWIPNWLAKQLLHLEAERESVKAHLSEMLRALDGRESHLHYVYDESAEAIVKGELVVLNEGKKKPKKSYAMPFGKAGYRMGRDKIEVFDEPKAIEWAEENSPLAVEVVTTKKFLKSNLPPKKLEAGEIPGVKFVPKTNSFFLTPTRPLT